ncbi:MAG: type I-E CRISPR-associated protein Cas6/Cse3/CasE [Proteobacteria bacterium]|nr:type I-E CRISPR-associated protein Cas6/Cse3/CasE [Pseudomonadota bacterium]MBU4472095.1 type I-E CRISPR-associated protein Cas6/Cse3/CasE [Pseudomonadota bacterium]MCG2752906.1 type I-E CRISPR-associated protein Cas6/Cse3/CasE [Desulfobacteraceae bacterium]
MVNLVKMTFRYDLLAKEKIYDNYSWHKKAWNMFEHHPELKDRNRKLDKEKGPTPFLSRYIQKSDHAELLIVSKHQPVKPDWCTIDQWQLIEIKKSYLSQPSYYFDLYANPTKSIKKPDGNGGFTKNGKRLTVMDQPIQIEWLLGKGQKHGFKLAEHIPLRIDKPVCHRFNRNGKKGLHIGVRFQGALNVTDRDLFRKAFLEGIGTAKGFGFGLLMVKPAQF